MTTNKPEVRVFRPSAQAGCPAMRIVFPSDRVSQENKYVRLSDYEALQAECEELKQALAESRANDQQAMAYLSEVRAIVGGDDFPDMVRKCENLRNAIRRLCNIYVVDDYYMGQLREERLEAAVNRAIEQVKETTK